MQLVIAIIIVIVAVIYVLWPFDFIPDPIVIAGWIDDIVVILAAIANLVSKMRDL